VIDAASSSIALNRNDPTHGVMLGLYPEDIYTYGLYVDWSRSAAGTLYGVRVDIENSSNTNNTSYASNFRVNKTGATNINLYGVYSQANDNQTGIGSREIYGMYASAQSNYTNGTSTAYGIYASAGGTPDQNYGVYYSGGLGGTGSKSAIVRTGSGPRHVYCQESPGNWFEDFGDGKTSGGKAIVKIAADYLETVTINKKHPMKVFITPTSNLGNWWIEKQNNSFILYAPDAPNGSTFDYRIVAKRKDFEDVRMAQAPSAYSDHYLYPDINDVPPEYRASWVKKVPEKERDPAWLSYLPPEEGNQEE
jgi:hypothetical protein